MALVVLVTGKMDEHTLAALERLADRERDFFGGDAPHRRAPSGALRLFWEKTNNVQGERIAYVRRSTGGRRLVVHDKTPVGLRARPATHVLGASESAANAAYSTAA
jgi:hypothetical protein